MSNQATVKVNVTSEGSIDRELGKAKELKDTLLAASRALASAAKQGAVSRSAALSAAEPTRGVTGAARAVGGDAGTGSASRDFARQAVGLGGLVRVYATFAANIFAATAAFGALSRAADTANLIKGLDQLGAAAGRNLGGLSKELVKATGNAISLREASEAVAKASSSGLTSENILRIGTVAKGAALALGVDMTDAVSRLTRGITKLEPELLDELGIFTRLDSATREYAKTLGKPVAALTDFERRQSFANAVLDEGQRKFGAISIETNPYSKLSAALADISFKGLDLVNKVLAPLVSVLSSSPTALAAAIVGISTVLLRQALPAITDWRQGLIKASEAANQLAIDSNKLRKARQEEGDLDLVSKEIQLTNKLGAAYTDLTKNKKASSATKEKIAGITSIDKVSEADIVALEARAKRLELTNKKYSSEDDITKSAKENALSKQRFANNSLEIAQIREITTSYRQYQDVRSKLDKLDADRPKGFIGRQLEQLSIDAANDRIASAAARKNTQSGILGNVASQLPVAGVRDSFVVLVDSVKKAMRGLDELGNPLDANKEKLTKLAAASTLAKGSFSILTQGATTLVSSLSNVFIAVGVAVAAYQVLSSMLSKNAKEAAALEASLDSLNAAFDNVSRTLENINNKDQLQKIGIDSTVARANALGDLSIALVKVNKNYSDLLVTSNYFDGAVDSVKDLFGFGVADSVSSSIASGITKGLEAVEAGPAKEQARKALADILKVDPESLNSFKDLDKVLRSLDYAQLQTAGLSVSQVLKTLASETQSASANLSGFKEALKETSKQASTMNAALKPQDDFSKLGTSLLETSITLTKALDSPIDSLNTLRELAKDTSALSLLPPDTSTKLAFAKEELDLLAGSLENQLNIAEKARAAFNKASAEATRIGYLDTDEKTSAKTALAAANASVAVARANIQEALKGFEGISKTIFTKGIDLLSVGLNKAMGEASIALGKGYLSVIKGAGGVTGAAEGQLRAQELNLQKVEIEQRYEQSRQTLLLTDAIEVNNLLTRQKNIEERLKNTRPSEAVGVALGTELGQITKSLDFYAKRGQLIGGSAQDALKARSDPNSPLTEAANSLKGYFAELFGKQGKLASILGQLQLNVLQKFAAVEGDRVSQAGRGTTADTESKQGQLGTLSTQQSLLGIYDAQLEARKAILEISIAENDFAKKQLENGSKLTVSLEAQKAVRGRKGSTKEDLDAAASGVQNALKDIADTTLAYEQSVNAAGIARINAQLSGEKTLADISAARRKQEQQDIEGITLANITAKELEVNNAAKLGAISEESAVAKRGEIELVRQAIEFSGKLLDLDSQRLSLEIDFQRIRAASAQGLDTTNLVQSAAATLASINSQTAALNILNAAKKQDIINTTEQNSLLAKQAAFNDSLTTITASLATVFGDLGSSIGLAVESMSKLVAANDTYKLSTTQLAREKEKINGNPNLDEFEKSMKVLEIEEQQGKLDKKNAKDQIQSISAIAGASKKLFSEKTAAYKVLSAAEKAASLVSLSIQATETAASLAALPGKIAGGVAQMFSQSGFGGFVGAAALLALLASLGYNKGSAKAPSGFDSAGQQEVQGTGQMYQNGQLVNRGGGALGDPTAKASSLTTGIEKIEEHTFNNLEFSNKMLEALKGIRTNTEGLSAVLLQQGFNIRSESQIGVGTTAGTYKGTMGTELRAADRLLGSIFGSSSGVASLASKITSSILGGKTSVELQDRGLQITGLISALAEGGNGLAMIYENVKRVVDGGWFRSDKTTYETMTSTLQGPATEAIANVFSGIVDTVKSAAATIGKDTTITSALINSFQVVFKTSFKDLKPEEITEALNQEFSVAFNQLAERVLPEFQRFRKPAEEFGNTVIRLARNIEVTNLAFTSIGKELITATDLVRRVEITETLIGLSGGLEKFVSQSEFFKDNFLTQAEKLAPVQKAVTAELGRLGLSSIDTRQEFAELIKTIDITTAGGAGLYSELMNIAEAFAEVYPETRRLASAEEVRKTKLQQQIEIYKLEGRENDALFLSRQEQLNSLDDSLKAGQLYIYALEDESNIKGKLKTAYDKESSAIKGIISTMESSIKTLKTYKDSLALSAQSNLSPQQRYEEARAQALRVAGIATGIATTDAERQAKNDAINQLPAISSAFLDASRAIFASSESYNADFAYIQQLIDSTSLQLTEQKSAAEMQLEQLNSQTGILELIKESTLKTADYSRMLVEAQQATATAQAGALGSGLSAQGFAGIDFNAYTRDFFDRLLESLSLPITERGTIPGDPDRATALGSNSEQMTALVAEIIATRNEIAQLRVDQQNQTTALIQTNYDASSELGSSIVQSYAGGYRGNDWETRNSFSLS